MCALNYLPNILKAHWAFSLSGHLSDITEHRSSISSNENLSSFRDENTRNIRSLNGLNYIETHYLNIHYNVH